MAHQTLNASEQDELRHLRVVSNVTKSSIRRQAKRVARLLDFYEYVYRILFGALIVVTLFAYYAVSVGMTVKPRPLQDSRVRPASWIDRELAARVHLGPCPPESKSTGPDPYLDEDFCNFHGKCHTTSRNSLILERICVCDLGYTGQRCETNLRRKYLKQARIYSLPYWVTGVMALTVTIEGNLAMVQEYSMPVDGPSHQVIETRACIYNTEGRLVKILTLPHERNMGSIGSIAGNGNKLFISGDSDILIFWENGTYITNMLSYTFIPGIVRLAVEGDTIWITASTGLHKITYNANYWITQYTLLVPSNSRCERPYGISVQPSYLVITCYNSHTIYYVNHTGTELRPPVGGKGPENGQLAIDRPVDVVTDRLGQAYVADERNRLVVQFSKDGQFLRNVVTDLDCLNCEPTALYINSKYLYIGYRRIYPRPESLILVKLL